MRSCEEPFKWLSFNFHSNCMCYSSREYMIDIWWLAVMISINLWLKSLRIAQSPYIILISKKIPMFSKKIQSSLATIVANIYEVFAANHFCALNKHPFRNVISVEESSSWLEGTLLRGKDTYHFLSILIYHPKLHRVVLCRMIYSFCSLTFSLSLYFVFWTSFHLKIFLFHKPQYVSLYLPSLDVHKAKLAEREREKINALHDESILLSLCTVM